MGVRQASCMSKEANSGVPPHLWDLSAHGQPPFRAIAPEGRTLWILRVQESLGTQASLGSTMKRTGVFFI